MENNTLKEINEKLDWLIDAYQEPKEVYTFKEACDYLCVGKTYLLGQIDEGLIRFKLKGREKLFKKKWLDDWMER